MNTYHESIHQRQLFLLATKSHLRILMALLCLIELLFLRYHENRTGIELILLTKYNVIIIILDESFRLALQNTCKFGGHFDLAHQHFVFISYLCLLMDVLNVDLTHHSCTVVCFPSISFIDDFVSQVIHNQWTDCQCNLSQRCIISGSVVSPLLYRNPIFRGISNTSL